VRKEALDFLPAQDHRQLSPTFDPDETPELANLSFEDGPVKEQ